MKSFGDWLMDLGNYSSSSVEELPEGVWEFADGKYKAKCCCCDNYYELYCDLSEFDPEYSYCGSGPRCCP